MLFLMATGTDETPPLKSVLWVEPCVEYRDPTARQLLLALPRLRAEGWTIKVWCLRSEAPREGVEHTFLPAPKLPGALLLIYFAVAANLYGFARWLARRPRPATIVHSSCGLFFGANLASIHFLNCVWLRKQMELGFRSWKEVASFFLHCVGAILERIHWWWPGLELALPVSDSIRDEVRRRTPASVVLETLPNGYDETRFNPAVRSARRQGAREELGFTAGEVVFAFVSLGHHERKGFWLAVEAFALLRADPAMAGLRFLVIGGAPATLAALRERLVREVPGWEGWLIFTGQQPEVEKYLAASDAFLYPSYFEAFCLAEIEAAAMGLPLLLTRHHGSEMILEEGVNGLWLEWNAVAIATQIRRFVAMGPDVFCRSTGAALTRGQYAERLLQIYERLLPAARPS